MKRDVWKNDQNVPRGEAGRNDRILPVVVPYNNIGTELATLWKTEIGKNEIFKDVRLISAYSNGPNLCKKLIRANLDEARQPKAKQAPANLTAGCHRCPMLKCKACNFITEIRSFRSSVNNRTFKINQHFNCKTTNLCYLINCRKCKKQYVGETERSLADRINDHLSCIRLKKPTPIGLHFNSPGHCVTDFSIVGIERFENLPNSSQTRRMKETTWQNLLQTAHPLGLNNLKFRHLNLSN